MTVEPIICITDDELEDETDAEKEKKNEAVSLDAEARQLGQALASLALF